jgi:hypothetical protein
MYEVTPYLLNNLGYVLAQLVLIIFFAVLLNKVNVDTDFIINHEVISTIILSLQKMFVWNFIFVMLLSNFQKLCIYTFVSLFWPSVYSPVGLVNFTLAIINTIVVAGLLIYVSRNINKIRNLLKGNLRSESKKVTNLSIASDKTNLEDSSRLMKKEDTLPSTLFNTPTKLPINENGLSPALKRSNFSFGAVPGLSPDKGEKISQSNSPDENNNNGSINKLKIYN